MYLVLEIHKNRLIITETAWRLQQDGTWRKLGKNDTVKPTDSRFSDPYKLLPYYRMDLPLVIQGKEIVVNPSEGDLLGESYDCVAQVYRESKPGFPSKEQMASVISRGNDRTDNSLVLRFDGSFDLIDRNRTEVVNNPTFAVRFETFNAGNGYVGPDAAADSSFIADTYLTMLFHWVSHLKGGKVNIYADYREPGVSEEGLRREIEGLIAHLK